ncbi:MAG TPA: carboxylating nicotinate-nucleotide diphosphorylase [Thermoanaerobaculaceae bacterium]|nr:carboxylating nicotinate-nucleotide diphosphorylase [Thermoanaerobaculaceae bacterium]
MLALPEPYATALPPLLAAAFAEDLPDLTGVAVFGPDDATTAVLVAKKSGILAGMPAFAAAFSFLDARCSVECLRADGDAAVGGDEVARVTGPARAILAAERTALNFATRLSGVATLTRRFVDAVAGTRCAILDTRKTTPGWRTLEKHAVRCGGGCNHRMGLFDAAMLKDTHLAAAGSITSAVAKVRDRWGGSVPLVVECADLAMVEEAVACGVGHIMLDNMDLETVAGAIRLVAGRARLEASGGVTLESAQALAAAGVDFVSVGALTHSAPALDLSLKVRR